MIDQSTTYIAISSHQADSEIWLSNLLPSLIDENSVPPENIYVVIGGCEEPFKQVINGINYHGVEHNSYDYTSLIEAVDYPKQPNHWLLLHETTRAAPGFWNTILSNTSPSNDFTCVSKQGWTNIGVLSASFLQEQRQFIKSFKNCGKFRAILGERLLMRMGQKTSYYFSGIPEHKGTFAMTPLMPSRHVYLYTELNLYKYQQYTADSPEFNKVLQEQQLIAPNKKVTL